MARFSDLLAQTGDVCLLVHDERVEELLRMVSLGERGNVCDSKVRGRLHSPDASLGAEGAIQSRQRLQM